jgi:hypothetical protein
MEKPMANKLLKALKEVLYLVLKGLKKLLLND